MLLPTEQQPFLTQGRPQHKERPVFPDTNNLLTTKRTLLYLKTQFVTRIKHFSSQLKKPII